MPKQRADRRADYAAIRGKRKFYQTLIAELAAFAESEFELNKIAGGSNETIRAQLECVWNQTGKKPKQLEDALEAPPLAAHIWQWFISLNNGRGSNGMESARITPDQVKGWMWFNGIPSLELWERKAIAALDNVWFAAQRNAK